MAGKTLQFTTAVVASEADPGTILTATVTGATAHTLIAIADQAPTLTAAAIAGNPAAAD